MDLLDELRGIVGAGGVLTGEHGVGVEKRDLMPVMFSDIDLKQQQRVKCAFDPELLLNPGKVFPQLHRCAELGRMHVHRGQTAFPDLPRFWRWLPTQSLRVKAMLPMSLPMPCATARSWPLPGAAARPDLAA